MIIPLPAKKYSIIYADPPWSYKDKSKSHGGGAESHYPCMSIEELCSLPVNEIANTDCVLFMWVTFPMLTEGLQLISSWDFKYKTCAFVWVKANKRVVLGQMQLTPDIDDFMGMGRWTRANAEICLLATKGKIARKSARVRQIIYSPIGEHSKKPEETRARIIKLVGALPRIELFAREKADGWDVWGNEVRTETVYESTN
jgi:N6-adenosine-specific RNA methylase IME4